MPSAERPFEPLLNEYGHIFPLFSSCPCCSVDKAAVFWQLGGDALSVCTYRALVEIRHPSPLLGFSWAHRRVLLVAMQSAAMSDAALRPGSQLPADWSSPCISLAYRPAVRLRSKPRFPSGLFRYAVSGNFFLTSDLFILSSLTLLYGTFLQLGCTVLSFWPNPRFLCLEWSERVPRSVPQVKSSSVFRCVLHLLKACPSPALLCCLSRSEGRTGAPPGWALPSDPAHLV